jgi:DNA polymerase-1
MADTLIIIDGMYQLNRFFNGIPISAKLSNGITVNAVYGFIAFLRRLAKTYDDSVFLCVFDSETGANDKKQIDSSYKSTRNIGNDSMFEQLEIIKKILDYLMIQYIEDPKYEADDVIGSIAFQNTSKYKKILIASHDNDFIQLLTSKIWQLKDVSGKLIEISENEVLSTKKILPCKYIMYLALIGDKSDNISGIKGIGPITASRICNLFLSIDDLFDHIDYISKSLYSKLVGRRTELINRAMFLTINTEIDITKYNINYEKFSSEKNY